MDKFWPTVVIVVIVVIVFVLIWRGWQARIRRGSALGPADTAPADTAPADTAPADTAPGDAVADLASVPLFYVATTAHGKPLERVAIPGLAYRGRATVGVTGAGITIAVAGEQSVYLPGSAVREVGTATSTIDRVVEPGGLVMVAWQAAPSAGTTAGPDLFDSYFRIVDPTDRVRLIAAIEQIAPDAAAAGAGMESEA